MLNKIIPTCNRTDWQILILKLTLRERKIGQKIYN